MSLASDSTRLFVANIVTTLVGLISFAYFAQQLGPAGLGIYVLFLALVGLLSMVADAGLGTATETRTSEGVEPGVVFSTSALLSGVAVVVLAAVILLVEDAITRFVGADVTVLLVATLVAGQALKVVTTTLKGELRVGETAEVTIFRQLVAASVGILFVWMGYGAVGIIYGFLGGTLAAALWGGYKIDTRPARPTVEMARSLWGYAKFNLVPTVSGQLTAWTDVVIIAWFLSRADVGTYEIAGKVAMVTLVLSSAIGTSVLPQVAAWRANGQTRRIGSFVSTAITPALLLVVPAFAGVVVLGPTVLSVGFGAEYAAGWLVLVVLLFGKLFDAVRQVTGRALLGMDRPDLLARATVVQTVVNIALNVLFIWSFGLVGAAVATTLASTVGTVLVTRALGRQTTLRYPVKEVAWLVLSAAGMAVTLWLAEKVIPVTSVETLVAAVVLGAVVYGGLVLASPVLREIAIEYGRSMTGDHPVVIQDD